MARSHAAARGDPPGRAVDTPHDRLSGVGRHGATDGSARVLAQASGHPVEFTPPPIEAVRQGSADFAAMLEWFDRVGYSADIEKTARESGIRQTTFAEWAASPPWRAASRISSSQPA